jgi:hypothetical protein
MKFGMVTDFDSAHSDLHVMFQKNEPDLRYPASNWRNNNQLRGNQDW